MLKAGCSAISLRLSGRNTSIEIASYPVGLETDDGFTLLLIEGVTRSKYGKCQLKEASPSKSRKGEDPRPLSPSMVLLSTIRRLPIPTQFGKFPLAAAKKRVSSLTPGFATGQWARRESTLSLAKIAS